MINGANFISAAGGSILLGYFGRKTLMIVCQFACIIGMVGMWIFSSFVESDTMMYILVIAFIGFFFQLQLLDGFRIGVDNEFVLYVLEGVEGI